MLLRGCTARFIYGIRFPCQQPHRSTVTSGDLGGEEGNGRRSTYHIIRTLDPGTDFCSAMSSAVFAAMKPCAIVNFQICCCRLWHRWWLHTVMFMWNMKQWTPIYISSKYVLELHIIINMSKLETFDYIPIYIYIYMSNIQHLHHCRSFSKFMPWVYTDHVEWSLMQTSLRIEQHIRHTILNKVIISFYEIFQNHNAWVSCLLVEGAILTS